MGRLTPPPSLPRICIDCSPLLVRSAGVKTYLYHWLHSLRALHPECIDTFLEPRTGELDHNGGPFLHPAKLATLQAVNLMPAVFLDLLLPKCDFLHVSNLLRTVPRAPALSATVHDLTAWIMPEFHRRVQVEADTAFAERVLRRAHGVIAVSENTRCDAIRILGLEPEKIRVIYPGVADSYFHATAAETAIPYFLYAGTIEPRKNVDTLLTAWMSLPASFRRENELVLVGMPGWKSEATLRRLAHLTAESSGVRYLGYVPESRIPGLTAGAQALIYPSYYEGFGMPVVQAMAAGCPVITSNAGSLPEVTGGAAVLIDPRSQNELACAIRNLRESPSLREKLRSAGVERARLFTWRTAAERTFQYFADLRG
jgi:glycosyltransferase involved in cell wall biosynthesis